MDLFSIVSTVATIFLTVLSGSWAIINQMNKRFNETGKLVYQKVEELEKTIATKLENHEMQDHQRFASLNDGVWDLRVRLAAKEGLTVLNGPSTKDR